MLKIRSYGSHVQLNVLSGPEAALVRKRTKQILLAVGMLVAGTANTLTCKAAFSSESLGEPFNHPFVMAGAMFIGEIACLGWHTGEQACRRLRRRKQHPAALSVPKYVFALPAFCDIAGTSVMYLGLTLTSASSYQMLRGSVIIFTGGLSAAYLKRRQWAFHCVPPSRRTRRPNGLSHPAAARAAAAHPTRGVAPQGAPCASSSPA